MKYNKKILSNGLTVVTVPSSDAESVVVDFFVKTGSRSESLKENGISHFLEHFLFKGTKKYPSTLAITELVDAVGGEMNANTGKEHTQYYIKAKSTHLALIFEILSDMLQHPLLDKEELEREKGVIVEEINMYKDMPMAEIDNVLERTMWPGEALGRDIGGSKQSVTKFSKEMFETYMGKFYQPGNMILGIGGKFSEKELQKLIQKYWQKIPNKRIPKWQKAVDRQNRARVSVEFKETEQAHFSLGFKGINYNDKRNAAALVLSVILGGGMSSRLFTEVRERRGLAYYIRANNSNYQDTGVFQIGSGVQVQNVQEALKVVISELKKITEVPVPEKELNKAKEYLKGKNTLSLEDNQSKLDWYLSQIAFQKKIHSPQDSYAEVDRVTSAAVQKLAKELFVSSKATLAVIGPYKSDKQFKELLKI